MMADIEIKRIKESWIITHLRPYFVEDGCHTRRVIAAEISRIVENSPDNTIVLVAFKANLEIVGYIIGWIPLGCNYVHLDQVWHCKTNGTDTADRGMQVLKEWAKSKGVKEIRFTTFRNALAMARRSGFKEHSVTMRLEI